MKAKEALDILVDYVEDAHDGDSRSVSGIGAVYNGETWSMYVLSPTSPGRDPLLWTREARSFGAALRQLAEHVEGVEIDRRLDMGLPPEDPDHV